MAGYSFAFSYSRWALWDTCPAAYKYKNIDKIPEPVSKAMERGRKVHDAAAAWVEGKSAQRPKELERFTLLADGIRAMPAELKSIEVQMAFDADNLPCSWFGPNARWRFIWDAAVVDPRRVHMDAVDWKTGSPKGSYDAQMQIFAIPAFWTEPALETFTGHLVYLDSGGVIDYPITREQFYGPSGDPARRDGLYGLWMNNAAMMESDRAFTPKPSFDACRWCNFHWKKGGPCKSGV